MGAWERMPCKAAWGSTPAWTSRAPGGPAANTEQPIPPTGRSLHPWFDGHPVPRPAATLVGFLLTGRHGLAGPRHLLAQSTGLLWKLSTTTFLYDAADVLQ
jgi:hypothetical protein